MATVLVVGLCAVGLAALPWRGHQQRGVLLAYGRLWRALNTRGGDR